MSAMPSCVGAASSRPARQVAAQLERAAVLVLYAEPRCRDARRGTAIPLSCTVGSHVSKAWFGADGIQTCEHAGRPIGSVEGSITLHAARLGSPAAGLPVAFHPGHSRHAVVHECRFEFGHQWEFCGDALGEVRPMLARRPFLCLMASGILRGTGERSNGLAGTFALSGELTEEGFCGIAICRVQDPVGRILRGRDIPAISARRIADPLLNYVVVTTTSVHDSAGTAEGVSIEGEVRAADFPVFAGDSLGLRAATRIGVKLGAVRGALQVIGKSVDPSIRSNCSFSFSGGSGTTVSGDFRTEGVAARPAVAGANDIGAFSYSGFGSLTPTGGLPAGAHAVVVTAGSVSVAPPVCLETAVIGLVDPVGRRAGSATASPESPIHRFLPLVRRTEELAGTHRRWRELFGKHAEPISTIVAARYNDVLHMGDFDGIPIDPAVWRNAMTGPIAPFNHEVFERYAGPARGEFRFYSQATLQATGGNTLYSYWNPATFRFGERYCKFITGSFERYFTPDEIPEFQSQRIDPIINSYLEDIGVVSYIRVYQGRPPGMFQERSSFAYKLPGAHEVMWIVKDLMIDGQPADPDIFMSSHEWKDHHSGQTRYLMVGMFWRLDPTTGAVTQADDLLWRALYVEEAVAQSITHGR